MTGDEEKSQEQLAEEREDRFAAYTEGTRTVIWTRDDTGHDLSVEEMLFVRSFIIDRNEVAALRRLGYGGDPSRLKYIAKKYLTNPEVQGAVDVLAKRMCEKLEVTAEKVISHMAAMAFFDPRSVMHFDGHTLRVLDSSLWNDQQIAAIKKIKMTEKAGVEIEFADKLTATIALGKQLNLLQDPDENQKRAAAEAAAEAAMTKIFEVHERVANKMIEDKKADETLQ